MNMVNSARDRNVSVLSIGTLGKVGFDPNIGPNPYVENNSMPQCGSPGPAIQACRNIAERATSAKRSVIVTLKVLLFEDRYEGCLL